MIEFNRQREKTPGQIVNEYEEIKRIERQRAKKRRQATQNNDTGQEIAETETFPEQGEAREKAAENFDYSGRTLDKGLEVKEKAEEGDEKAQEEWEKLQKGEASFSKAHRTVKPSP